MFERARHNAIMNLLRSFNSDILQQAECYFAGGTAISLSLNEFRESVDINFLCASVDGYRLLRNLVSNDLGTLLNKPVNYLREVRTDQYRIFTVLESDNIPVKVEIVREARIDISGSYNSKLQIPMLSQEDLFAQKLLANADRELDRSSMSRDIIDLAIMIDKWGDIPEVSWNKAVHAYGDQIANYFAKSIKLIHDEVHLHKCIEKMAMDDYWNEEIPRILINTMHNLKDKGIVFPDIEIKNHSSLAYCGR